MATMTRPTADMLAPPLASFLAHHRPDLKITHAVIASELTRATTPMAVTMQGAWKLAGALAAGTGLHKTFAGLADVAGALLLADQPPTPPASQPPAPATSPEPCPAHFWAPANNCGACWSEIKTGHRPASAYGARTWPEAQEPTGQGARPSEAHQGPALVEGSR